MALSVTRSVAVCRCLCPHRHLRSKYPREVHKPGGLCQRKVTHPTQQLQSLKRPTPSTTAGSVLRSPLTRQASAGAVCSRTAPGPPPPHPRPPRCPRPADSCRPQRRHSPPCRPRRARCGRGRAAQGLEAELEHLCSAHASAAGIDALSSWGESLVPYAIADASCVRATITTRIQHVLSTCIKHDIQQLRKPDFLAPTDLTTRFRT